MPLYLETVNATKTKNPKHTLRIRVWKNVRTKNSASLTMIVERKANVNGTNAIAIKKNVRIKNSAYMTMIVERADVNTEDVNALKTLKNVMIT